MLHMAPARRDYYVRKYVPKGAKLRKETTYYQWWTKGRDSYLYFKGTNPYSAREWAEDLEAAAGYQPRSWKHALKQGFDIMKKHPGRTKVFGYSRGGGLAEALGGTGFGAWSARGYHKTSAVTGAVPMYDESGGISGWFHNHIVIPVSHIIEGDDPVSISNNYRLEDVQAMRPPPPGHFIMPNDGSHLRDLFLGPLKRRYEGSATGVTNFKKPRLRPKRSTYLARGFQAETEYHGTQELGHVAFIGHTSHNVDDLGYDLGVAILRYIMARHYKVNYTAVHDDIWNRIETTQGEGTVTAVREIRFHAREANADGTEQNLTTVNINVMVDDGLALVPRMVHDFAVNFRDNVFKNASFQFDGGPRRGIYAYQIVEQYYTVKSDSSLNKETRLLLYVHIQDMYVKAYSTVIMKVQNVTPADTTNDSTDHKSLLHLEHNPLRGKLYHFRGPLPTVKRTYQENSVSDFDADTALNRFAVPKGSSGLLMPNQANASMTFPEFTGQTGAYMTAPDPNLFDNLSKFANISLGPGEMKEYKITFTFDGKLQRLIDGWNIDTSSGGYQGLGTSFMFGLEKTLKTGQSDNIIINWHVDHHHGAMIKKVPRIPFTKLKHLKPETTGLAP